MPRATLEQLASRVDRAAHDALTHRITIDGRPIRVQAFYGDGAVTSGFSAALEQQSEMLLLKTEWPSKPTPANRIRTSRKPGSVFQPIDIQDDDNGTHWLFRLKKVSA